MLLLLQLLVQGLAEQLLRLPVRFEEAEVPLWADSAADYKEAVGTFRSQVSDALCVAQTHRYICVSACVLHCDQ